MMLEMGDARPALMVSFYGGLFRWTRHCYRTRAFEADHFKFTRVNDNVRIPDVGTSQSDISALLSEVR